MPKNELKARIDALIKEHGGVRRAARAVDIDASYLLRLRVGTHRASDKTLKKLGFARTEQLVAVGG